MGDQLAFQAGSGVYLVKICMTMRPGRIFAWLCRTRPIRLRVKRFSALFRTVRSY